MADRSDWCKSERKARLTSDEENAKKRNDRAERADQWAADRRMTVEADRAMALWGSHHGRMGHTISHRYAEGCYACRGATRRGARAVEHAAG